jgi:hypothetical protein
LSVEPVHSDVIDLLAPLAASDPHVVVAQSQGEVGTGLFGSAVGAFLGTLIVGGIMLLALEDYTLGKVRELADEPGAALLYGLLSLVVLIVVTIALALTIVGILFVIPLAIVAYVLWVVGAAIAYIAVGDRIVGHDAGWFRPLLVGSAINGILVLTGIGGLVSFVVGAAGFGAVLRGWFG